MLVAVLAEEPPALVKVALPLGIVSLDEVALVGVNHVTQVRLPGLQHGVTADYVLRVRDFHSNLEWKTMIMLVKKMLETSSQCN